MPRISISIIWYLPISLLCAGLIASLYYCIVDGNFGTMAESGQFGDSFGALNAIFTGVSLGGLVISLVLQRRDLQATLNEMAESTLTQTRTTETLEKQLLSMDRNNTLRILEKRLSTSSSFDKEEDKNYAELIVKKLTNDIIADSIYDTAIIPSVVAYTAGLFKNDPDYEAGLAFTTNLPMEITAVDITPDSTLKFEISGSKQSDNSVKVDILNREFNFKYRTNDSYNEVEFRYKLSRNGKLWVQKLILIKDLSAQESHRYREVLGQPYPVS